MRQLPLFALMVSVTCMAQDNARETDLLSAAAAGNATLAREALAGGLNPDVRGKEGATPLMIASARGHYEVVKLLLEKGANVNAKESEFRMSPLMVAAQRGRVAVCELLLNAKADVNLEDKDGATALGYAALGSSMDDSLDGNEAVISLLRGKGATGGLPRNSFAFLSRGNAGDSDKAALMLWMFTKPLPPSCYEHLEVPPCGRKKECGAVTSGPDFGGKWQLNARESDFGEAEGFKLANPNGSDIALTLLFKLNGEEVTRRFGDGLVRTKATKAPGDVLLLSTTVPRDEGPLSLEWRWFLTNGNSRLVNNQRMRVGAVEMGQKLVYDRLKK